MQEERVEVVFSNERGPVPSDAIQDFCGKQVITALMAKPFVHNGRPTRQIRVNFIKDGRKHHVLKAKIEGSNEFLFHVYKHI